MPATVLAAVPSNVEAGSYMTFAGPVLAFCIIGSILYVLLFARPHPRVPPRLAATANAGAAAQATSAPGTTAPGTTASGTAASSTTASSTTGAEAPEAHQETTTTDDRGNVSGGTPDGEQGTSEDSEAGE